MKYALELFLSGLVFLTNVLVLVVLCHMDDRITLWKVRRARAKWQREYARDERSRQIHAEVLAEQ